MPNFPSIYLELQELWKNVRSSLQDISNIKTRVTNLENDISDGITPSGLAGGILGYPGSTYPNPNGLAAIDGIIPISGSETNYTEYDGGTQSAVILKTSDVGKFLSIRTQDGTGAQEVGAIRIGAGSAENENGGNVSLAGGYSTNGYGGSVLIAGGYGGLGTGSIYLRARYVDFKTNQEPLTHRFSEDGLETNKNIFIYEDSGVAFYKTVEPIGSPSPAIQSSVLDDYEEGTWTPLFGIASGIPPSFGSFAGITYYSNKGSYTKIGNLVYLTGKIHVNVASSTAGDLVIGNLPYVCKYSSYDGFSGIISRQQNFPSGSDHTIRLYIPMDGQDSLGTDWIEMIYNSNTNVPHTWMVDNTYIYFSISYLTET